MKICVAQIKSEKGNIEYNIAHHKRWIDTAISCEADLIVFPELSLTGYEPELAGELATDQNDMRLDEFQQMSDLNKIAIGIGLPAKSRSGISIGIIFFQPHQPRQTYAKQKLHSDELPYFVEGAEQLIITIEDVKIAPAICYESLQSEHAENAIRLGAELYMASVAKSHEGIRKAFIHFPQIAKKYTMPVLMANCVGYCDNFESAGQTSVWDETGTLIGRLDKRNEGILIFDTETKELVKKTVPNVYGQ
ncbi:carbon-nitrogen hydrolase family protein [Fulvivirgaceae bacterium BMA10]|uniref:Carbon-nitrogen hydrolase family protein n=1 Tax=Splendidivirga corallicola TaxID=3051826 RepID=A0ABT8KT16_9BACT|nr:carbon-nitrogen hydrolase family protein [Fulvivirgaceae bacterium BMA10]